MDVIYRLSRYRANLPYLSEEIGAYAIIFTESDEYSAYINQRKNILALDGDFSSLGLTSFLGFNVIRNFRIQLGGGIIVPIKPISTDLFSNSWHLEISSAFPVARFDKMAISVGPQLSYQTPFKSKLARWSEWQFGVGLTFHSWSGK